MAEASKVNPHDLVVRPDVENVLKIDKGSGAILKSFEVQDFTSKGDNYVCDVCCVVVQYDKCGESCEISYIVKLNPGHKGIMNSVMSCMFENEIIFFSKIVPLLNEELAEANETSLKVPKYYYGVCTKDKEILYLEDLRILGFKMHSRHDTLDKAHVNLIIKELARFHASSVLLFSKEEYSGDNFYKKFPDVLVNTIKMKTLLEDAGMKMMASAMTSAAHLTDEIPNYQHVSEFLKFKVPTVDKEMDDLVMKLKEPFIIIRHGDCWNNNFLFRYSPSGDPVECRLLDFQRVRLGSPATDLNHFLFPCLSAKVRKVELSNFLGLYYSNFAGVLSGADTMIKFSLEELKTEFHSKLFFGFAVSVMIVPALLLDPKDAPSIDDFFGVGEGKEEALIKLKKKINTLTLVSPNLRLRLLDMFDELNEINFFKKSEV